MHSRDTLINLASHGTEEAEPHQREMKNLATKSTKEHKFKIKRFFFSKTNSISRMIYWS